MRVRVLKSIFYGHRPEAEPEFDVTDVHDEALIARGLKHGLLEEVKPKHAKPVVAVTPEPEPPTKAAPRKRGGNK